MPSSITRSNAAQTTAGFGEGFDGSEPQSACSGDFSVGFQSVCHNIICLSQKAANLKELGHINADEV